MATGSDQAAGYSLVGLALAIFSYYTIWVIVLPFVDSDQSIHSLFPPRIYAIAGPLVAGMVALILIGSFFAFVSMRKKKAKAS